MKFFIYYRPVTSIRKSQYLGDMVHISDEDKSFSPDGEIWRARRCNRPEAVYNRLITMLRNDGMVEDNIHVLSCRRSIKDLINYMNTWGK